jgi:hypothetical protein
MSYTSTHSDNRRDGRDADFAEVQRGLQSSDPNIRKAAAEAGRKISSETTAIREMRAALINEHRHGRMDNVKDIQMEMAKHASLQNR